MKRFILFILLFYSVNVGAQKYDYNWVFGDSVGVNFNMLSPNLFTTSSISRYSESYSSISDAVGNLLYYIVGYNSGGILQYCCSHILDVNGNEMINGDSLPLHGSTTQGALIVPLPGDSLKYYVFYLSGEILGILPMGLSYAVVDISSNGGLGTVITKNNLLLNDTLAEKLTAVKHANGRDWWILCRKMNGNKLYSFLFTPYGISNGPIQILPDSGWDQNPYFQGMMKFNIQGTKLSIVETQSTHVLLYDFDRCTGLLGKCDTLHCGITGYDMYGCSFSPDGNKLYVSDWDRLYQFDLTSTNIQSTIAEIWNDSASNYMIGHHLLAPDGKIYIVSGYYQEPNNIYHFKNKHLTVINNPNSLGVACNVAPYSFSLGTHRSRLGLPNMVNYNLGALAGSPCDTLTAIHEENKNHFHFSIYPNPVNTTLNVTINTIKEDQQEIFLQNVMGQQMFSKTLELHPGKNNSVIDVSGFAKGIYFYSVIKDGMITDAKGKVVVMH